MAAAGPFSVLGLQQVRGTRRESGMWSAGECGEKAECGQPAAVLLETRVGCFLDPSDPSQGITFNSSEMALDPRAAGGSGRATHAGRVPAHRVPSPRGGLPRFSASGAAARPKAPGLRGPSVHLPSVALSSCEAQQCVASGWPNLSSETSCTFYGLEISYRVGLTLFQSLGKLGRTHNEENLEKREPHRPWREPGPRGGSLQGRQLT